MTKPKDPIQDLTRIVLDMQAQIQTQFESINSRFDQMATKESMQIINGRLDRFEARLERLEDDMREGFDRVNTTLDGVASRLDIDDTERVALSAQVTRHEDWLVNNAPTLGVSYTPGA